MQETDRDTLSFQKLDVYIAARELAVLIHRAKIADAELREQATRAAKSTFLRLCEGLPNEGAAMRRRYFTIANDSLHEAIGAVDLAAAIGAMRAEDARGAHALGARIKPMLRGLLHSK